MQHCFFNSIVTQYACRTLSSVALRAQRRSAVQASTCFPSGGSMLPIRFQARTIGLDNKFVVWPAAIAGNDVAVLCTASSVSCVAVQYQARLAFWFNRVLQ